VRRRKTWHKHAIVNNDGTNISMYGDRKRQHSIPWRDTHIKHTHTRTHTRRAHLLHAHAVDLRGAHPPGEGGAAVSGKCGLIDKHGSAEKTVRIGTKKEGKLKSPAEQTLNKCPAIAPAFCIKPARWREKRAESSNSHRSRRLRLRQARATCGVVFLYYRETVVVAVGVGASRSTQVYLVMHVQGGDPSSPSCCQRAPIHGRHTRERGSRGRCFAPCLRVFLYTGVRYSLV